MSRRTSIGGPAAEHATAASALQRKSGLVAPLAALGLAAAAIAGAYATSKRHTPTRPHTTIVGVAPTHADNAPDVVGAFPPEPGPEGTEGQWVGDVASVAAS